MKRITIKHHNKNDGIGACRQLGSGTLQKFSVILYTDTNTIIDGVEFTPLAYEVYKDILNFNINIDKFYDATFLSKEAVEAILDRQALMENWLWHNYNDCYRVFIKKHSAFMDTLDEF